MATTSAPKAADFTRVAEARTTRVLEHLRILEGCANRSRYAYTDEQVQAILAAIRAKVDELEASFADPPPKRIEFTLPIFNA